MYEEKDCPLESKIISKDKNQWLNAKRKQRERAIKGFNLFPDGCLQGSGILLFIVMVFQYPIGKGHYLCR
ncbi:MAG: hypothetical protein ACTHJ2_08440 [Candidatus Nitrosocosmicus sp.]